MLTERRHVAGPEPDQIPGRPARVVFADATDERVLAAVRVLARDQMVAPVVVEPPADAVLPTGVETIGVYDPVWSARCRDEYLERSRRRNRPGDDPAVAVQDPLMFAALLTAAGGADVGVAGSLSTSASVIRAGLTGIGLEDPDGLVTGCFLMDFGGRTMTFADVAVIPDPDAEQLARIAVLAADFHTQVTGSVPRVAMLSFSTHGSAEHANVTKVRDAVALVRDRRPDLLVDGELQFDVAVTPELAARKCPGSPVAGQANVLVFPDLGAGNITYKAAERMAGARATGSFVLGLWRPWVDLSRGCSVGDIVDAALAAAALCSEGVTA